MWQVLAYEVAKAIAIGLVPTVIDKAIETIEDINISSWFEDDKPKEENEHTDT